MYTVTKMTKMTDLVMTDREMLLQVVKFCQHELLDSQRETSFFQPIESDLLIWINTTTSLILENVIPMSFWDNPTLPEVMKINSLGETPLTISDGIVMLILWASWDQDCCQNIVNCLEYGANVLKSHHLQWMCSFASCISLTLQYSAFTLPMVSKSKLQGNNFTVAICLRQSVKMSSKMYQVFDSYILINKTVSLFRGELPPCKLLPVVSKEPPGGYHIKKEGKDPFTLVSIFDWYKKNQTTPMLNQMLALKPIQALVREITTAMSEENITIHKFSEEIELHATVTLGKLHFSMEEGCSARLVAFVMMACHFIKKKAKKKPTPMSEEKEMLLVSFFAKCLGFQKDTRNARYELKRIIETKKLVSMDFVAELISHKFNLEDDVWCCYLKLNDILIKDREVEVTRKMDIGSISTILPKHKQLVSKTHNDSIFLQSKKRKSSQQEKQVSFSSETVDHTMCENSMRRIRRSSSSLITKSKIRAARELHKAL